MWEEMERSPALAAPGSNNFGGLIASTTNASIGSKQRKVQPLSEEDENDLCERYRPLAFKIERAAIETRGSTATICEPQA